MMMTGIDSPSLKSQIEKVVKERSVLEYLAQRGHSPFSSMGGGRYKFLCPFADHKESKPSFVVYTGAEYENWYCYGCARGYNIVHLVSYLDNISFYDALAKISDGIVISCDDDLISNIKRLDTELVNGGAKDSTLGHSLIQASEQCLLFCQGVNFNAEEVKKVDNYYALLDILISNVEFDKIDQTVVILPDVLQRRMCEFRKNERKN